MVGRPSGKSAPSVRAALVLAIGIAVTTSPARPGTEGRDPAASAGSSEAAAAPLRSADEWERRLRATHLIDTLLLPDAGNLSGPFHMSGDLTPSIAAPGGPGDERHRAVSRAFLAEQAGALGSGGFLPDLAERSLRRDRHGRVHVAYEARVAGLRLEGSETLIHLEPDGTIFAAAGTLVPIAPEQAERVRSSSAAARPDVDAIRAVVAADLAARGRRGPPWFIRTEQVATAGDPAVVWIVDVGVDAGAGRWLYRLDAATGAVLERQDALQTSSAAAPPGPAAEGDEGPQAASGRGYLGNVWPHLDTYLVQDPDLGGVYYLSDVARRASLNPHGHDGRMADDAGIETGTVIDGLFSWLTDRDDDIWIDAAQVSGVDAHAHAARVYDYQRAELGINGYDDAGGAMWSIVDYDCGFDNAGYGALTVLFCRGVYFPPFSGALDIVAHEWGHAVTELLPGGRRTMLTYAGESGALNEAFSDWFGVATEQAYGGSDWTMGERIVTLRDLSNPQRFGQPDTYKGRYWLEVSGCVPVCDPADPARYNDCCGVHTNSGVGNKMFYLLSRGSSFEPFGTFNGVAVTGLGVDAAMEIALAANADYWLQNETFAGARQGMILAAGPHGAFAVDQVKNAWAAVRVGLPASALRLTAPNGGEAWQAGTAQTIRWTFGVGAGSSARIELLKGGLVARTLSTGAAMGTGGAGMFTWTLPGALASGDDYAIRLTSTASALVTDTSDATFRILGSTLRVVAPNGGEALQSGATTALSWAFTGNPGSSVRLELLRDGVLSRVISNGAAIGSAGTGRFNWAVPAAQPAGPGYTLKISSTANPLVNDASDGGFTILPPTITLVQPENGAIWHGGDRREVRWTSTGSPGPYVRIDLLAGGSVVRTLATGAGVGGGSGAYIWKVPAAQAPGDDYAIRVTSTNAATGNVGDTSDGSFSILAPTLAVTRPAEHDALQSGTVQAIRWAFEGLPGPYVRIDLRRGDTLVRTLTTGASIGRDGAGAWNWTIPAGQPAGEDYALRIASTALPSVHGTAGPFTILPPVVTLTDPDGGEEVQSGTVRPIRWTYAGRPGSLRIELLKAGVVNRVLSSGASIGTAGAGVFNWSVAPAQTPGSDYAIRLASTTFGAVLDVGEAFTVLPPALRVTAPDGGETIDAGDRLGVRWTFAGKPGPYVRIDLLRGGAVVRTLANGASIGSNGTGAYNWTVPAGQAPADDYGVRVTSTNAATGAVGDMGDGPFAIRAPTLTVTTPNGGENFVPGTAHALRWTFTGRPGPYVRVELHKAGVLNRTLATGASIGTAGAGVYNWAVPSTQAQADDYTIRVSSTALAGVADVSDATFTIGTVAFPTTIGQATASRLSAAASSSSP